MIQIHSGGHPAGLYACLPAGPLRPRRNIVVFLLIVFVSVPLTVPGSESINLAMFNELVSGDPSPVRLDRILWKAEERSGGKRLVVVIDEYPNLVDGAAHNGGLINNFIESVKDHSRLFLILCGSSMSIMESEVLGKKSPLYGRRTGQIMLHPLDFRES